MELAHPRQLHILRLTYDARAKRSAKNAPKDNKPARPINGSGLAVWGNDWGVGAGVTEGASGAGAGVGSGAGGGVACAVCSGSGCS